MREPTEVRRSFRFVFFIVGFLIDVAIEDSRRCSNFVLLATMGFWEDRTLPLLVTSLAVVVRISAVLVRPEIPTTGEFQRTAYVQL